jgi:hypothetical protein
MLHPLLPLICDSGRPYDSWVLAAVGGTALLWGEALALARRLWRIPENAQSLVPARRGRLLILAPLGVSLGSLALTIWLAAQDFTFPAIIFNTGVCGLRETPENLLNIQEAVRPAEMLAAATFAAVVTLLVVGTLLTLVTLLAYPRRR